MQPDPRFSTQLIGKHTKRLSTSFHFLFALAACLILSACGGGSGDDHKSGVVLPDTVNSTISTTGGTLELATPEGATLTLTIPPDALDTATPFSIQRASDGSFSIEPAGLRLVPPATLRLTRSTPFEPLTHFAWTVGEQNFILPTAVVEGGIQAEIGLLGIPGSEVTATNTLRISAVQSATLRPAAETDSAAATLTLTTLECSQRIPALRTELQAASNNDLDRATVLANELLAVRTACQEAEIQALVTEACSKYDAALLNAQNTTVTSLDVFDRLLKPLIATSSHSMVVGGDCVDLGVMTPVVDGKLDQLIEILNTEINEPDFINEFLDRRLRSLFDIETQCTLLTLPDATCNRFRVRLYPKLLDLMRISAYQDCLDDGTGRSLSRLLAESRSLATSDRAFDDRADFTDEHLEADILHCTDPVLTMTVFKNVSSVPEEVPERNKELRSRGEFDPQTDPFLIEHDATEELSVPRSGSFTLSGNVRVPPCPDESVSNDELVAKIRNIEIARRPAVGNRWNIDVNPFDIVISRDLETVGLDPINTTAFTLELYREGQGCGGTYSSEQKLYDINVTVVPFGLAITPADPSVLVGGTTSFDALLDGQQTSNVTWQSTGGSITSNGTYTAGTTPGVFSVTATLLADSRITATTDITVMEAPTSFRVGGRIIVDYDFSLTWDDTESVCESILSGGATCSQHRTGSLSGNARTEIDIQTPNAIQPFTNSTANSTIAGNTSGSLSGTLNLTSNETKDSCTISGTSNAPVTMQLDSDLLVSSGNWFINLQDENLFLGESAGTTFTFSGPAGPSAFTSTISAGCQFGPSSDAGTLEASNRFMSVRMPLGVLRGQAPANENTWSGTASIQVSNQFCANHFDSTLFNRGGSLKWLSNDASTCTLNVDVSWELNKL